MVGKDSRGGEVANTLVRTTMLDTSEGTISLIVCVNGTPWRHAGKGFVAVSGGPGPCSKRSDEAESREDGSDRAQGCLFLRWDWPVGCGVLKDSTGACEPGGAVGPGSGVQLGPAKWTMVT